MKYIFVLFLTATVVVICMPAYAQARYQLLIEGDNWIGRSQIDTTMTWYAYYEGDSVAEQGTGFKKIVKLKISKGDRDSTIRITSNYLPGQSIFLLGSSEKLTREPFGTCGSFDEYSFTQGRLAPGNPLGGVLPTMSCSVIQLLASGSAQLNKDLRIQMKDYRLSVLYDPSRPDHTKKREQEITSDILKRTTFTTSIEFGEYPSLYAMGDFNRDYEQDFVIRYNNTYHLYLSNLSKMKDKYADHVSSIRAIRQADWAAISKRSNNR